ncbi:hypothetical protein EJ04DRAFT_367426 [Polyplosphaeria fusca]|uniref:Uncharacterized protein n=1 Tax=Polyplosphaeria fusca TaxID=682080 RepID=A0A9P4V003_9PLEO|nr:hypothetical protein EJ04DRAFT_367426 [Polyplosphaeria fusca]
MCSEGKCVSGITKLGLEPPGLTLREYQAGAHVRSDTRKQDGVRASPCLPQATIASERQCLPHSSILRQAERASDGVWLASEARFGLVMDARQRLGTLGVARLFPEFQTSCPATISTLASSIAKIKQWWHFPPSPPSLDAKTYLLLIVGPELGRRGIFGGASRTNRMPI